MDVAEKMCDFIFMIYRGRKVLDGTLEAIQGQYGNDVVRVQFEANGSAGGPPMHEQLARIAGVERVNDFGRLQELRLAQGADTQQILAALLPLGAVRHFELARPSLNDIFVRIARPEAVETSSAEQVAGESSAKA